MKVRQGDLVGYCSTAGSETPRASEADDAAETTIRGPRPCRSNLQLQHSQTEITQQGAVMLG